MPTYAWFAATLYFVGLATQTFTTTAHGAMQMWTEPSLRGRVMAIMMAVAVGGTPLGAPLLGHIADTVGPRWAVGAGAASGFVAALVGLLAFARLRRAAAQPA
jgi:MFS family permease